MGPPKHTTCANWGGSGPVLAKRNGFDRLHHRSSHPCRPWKFVLTTSYKTPFPTCLLESRRHPVSNTHRVTPCHLLSFILPVHKRRTSSAHATVSRGLSRPTSTPHPHPPRSARPRSGRSTPRIHGPRHGPRSSVLKWRGFRSCYPAPPGGGPAG